MGDNAIRAAPMTTEDQITPTNRSAELLRRGPAPASRGRLRLAVRRGLLRAMRPYTCYQHALDAELVAALERQEASLQRHEAELAHLRTRHSEQIERLEQLARELIQTAESLRRATAEASDRSADSLRRVNRVTDDLYALPYVADSPFESFESPVGEVVGFRSRIAGGDGVSTYVAFEELFRGPAERVAASQRPYLDLVRGHQPVLDVGCGRGEFLALLASEGISATGVDSDAGMVERSRALGLEVVHGDGNEHLESLPDGALGSIFSAQVIEHLTYQELSELLSLARRKLRQGGMFIAETVNPHRIASLKTFWVDPTHERPIFPEVALALCAIAGFEQAYVFAPGFDSFDQACFDSPAYAVVATAP